MDYFSQILHEYYLKYLDWAQMDYFSQILHENFLMYYLTSEDLKELINDKNLNFLENLLIIAYKLAANEIQNKGYRFEHDWDIFPRDFLEKEKKFLKKKLKDILKQNNVKMFIPLYASDLSTYFDEQEISEMIKDENINLLKLFLTAEEKYWEVLSRFNEYSDDYYKIYKKFLYIIKSISDTPAILKILRICNDMNLSSPIKNEIKNLYSNIEKKQVSIEKYLSINENIKTEKIISKFCANCGAQVDEHDSNHSPYNYHCPNCGAWVQVRKEKDRNKNNGN